MAKAAMGPDHMHELERVHVSTRELEARERDQPQASNFEFAFVTRLREN
jgi:hypothetical protein